LGCLRRVIGQKRRRLISPGGCARRRVRPARGDRRRSLDRLASPRLRGVVACRGDVRWVEPSAESIAPCSVRAVVRGAVASEGNERSLSSRSAPVPGRPAQVCDVYDPTETSGATRAQPIVRGQRAPTSRSPHRQEPHRALKSELGGQSP
jgi:hypothetical protein